MTTRRGFLAATAAAAGLPHLARPAFAQAPGGTLAVAIFADPLSFDPHLAANLQGRGACRAIHDSLFTVDNDGRLAPGLCESWDQPDDKTFVLRLRRNVRFHDGTAFDAEAVRINIARIFDPALGSIRPGEISALDKVDVIDSHTLRMTLKYPFAAFLFPFTDVTGCIASPTALAQHGRDYGLRPSGTGPFRLVEYLKDARTVLEKNPTYWQQGRPHLDRVVLRPIPVDSTRLAELRSGGVQIAEALPLQDIRRLRQGRDFVVSERVGFRWEYFGFNLRDIHPSRSKAFRQAFQWGIDREALHQVAYFGTGAVGFDGILPGSPFHDPDYRPFRRDMDRARRLIAESGITTPVTMVGPLQPDPVKQRAAQIFQANAAELGVQIRIEQLDSAGYRNQLQSGQMPLDLQGWWGYRPDPDQYLFILLHSTGSYARFHGYSNPRMDELLMAQRATGNEAERRRIFRQISDLMNEDAVYVPWHYSSDFKGLHPRVRNFVHAPDGIIDYRPIQLG